LGQKPITGKGTLEHASAQHLRTLEGRPTEQADRKYHLEQWAIRFGHRRPDSITPEEIQEQLAEWLQTFAPSTVRHRCMALLRMFAVQFPGVANPVEQTARPAVAEPDPRNMPHDVVLRILAGFSDRG